MTTTTTTTTTAFSWTVRTVRRPPPARRRRRRVGRRRSSTTTSPSVPTRGRRLLPRGTHRFRPGLRWTRARPSRPLSPLDRPTDQSPRERGSSPMRRDDPRSRAGPFPAVRRRSRRLRWMSLVQLRVKTRRGVHRNAGSNPAPRNRRITRRRRTKRRTLDAPSTGRRIRRRAATRRRTIRTTRSACRARPRPGRRREDAS